MGGTDVVYQNKNIPLYNEDLRLLHQKYVYSSYIYVRGLLLVRYYFQRAIPTAVYMRVVEH